MRCSLGHEYDPPHASCPTCAGLPTEMPAAPAPEPADPPAPADPQFGFAPAPEVRLLPAELGASAAARLLERYLPIREIASGGMGKILLVQERRSGRFVALKVMLSAGAAAPRSLVMQFIREGVIAARLEHPHIVPVYDLGFLDGELYYTMRYVDGAPLSHQLPHLSLARRLIVLRDAARAVEHAHLQGLWHRDLKPGNILVGERGDNYVIDWGLVTVQKGATYQLDIPPIVVREQAYRFQFLDRMLEETREAITAADGMFVGTPAYMAPEQVQTLDEWMGARSDVWAFGVMLFEALTGRHPFSDGAQSREEIFLRILSQSPAPRDLDPQVPEPLDALCRQLLSRDHRPSTLRGFIQELERYLGLPPTPSPYALSRQQHNWDLQPKT